MDPEQLRALVQAAGMLHTPCPQLPTPATPHGRGYLNVLKKMPSFHLIQQL